jgi:hypothetical protein
VFATRFVTETFLPTVEPAKEDKKPPRIIAAEESKALFDWMQATRGWRLPLLFLEGRVRRC